MKTAILLVDGVKQIMFTAETDMEREALSYITPEDDIQTVIYSGSFTSDCPEVFGANIYKCNAGYYRAEKEKDSVMFVLTPKKAE